MGVFLVLLGGIFWAISGVLAEYLFKNDYAVEWVSFYRLLFTGILLLIISLRRKNFVLFKSKNELLSLLIFAFFGLLMTQYGYFKGIFYTDAGTATMMQYSAPIIIMLFVCFRDKKFPKYSEIVALILIVLGIFLLASSGDVANLNLNFWGVFWSIIGAFGVAFYSLSARKIIAKYGLFFVMGMASLFASFVLLSILETKGGLVHYDFSLKAFLAMSGIVLIGTIGAFCLYLKGVELIGVMRASMIACIEPVAAAFMSFLFLGTRYAFLELFAFALIIISIILNAKKN
ncbi:DMT family transporter [Campylobacter sp. US33a]|uniref:DMT family transporter n=1 Tax=Campylobacter sp. US33a TaxID=2498120 RepID=UPI001067A8FF|nr:DMT family transporter [Campylobacter sp. US33a]TEY01591.1 EamA/RhaT family transporter [Campylobacter sp. US33a]